jgi:uncharacterized protein YcnI
MFLRALAIAAVAILAVPATALAHVELSPDRVEPGSFTLFTVLSPNENDQPLTGLRLTLPSGMSLDAAADTPGFTTKVLENASHRVVGISWQGGSVPPEDLALFRFSASVDDTVGVRKLTGLQTFADGSTRLWRTPQVEVESASQSDSNTLPIALAAVAAALAIAALGVCALLLRERRGRRI